MLKTALLERFSADDLDDAVRHKQDQFAGLLTDEAALRVLAHESGIVPSPPVVDVVPLSSLSMGQMASVKARVLAVFATKRFFRDGKEGKLCKVRIADASGSAELVLWNSDADAASALQRNTVVLLQDVTVKSLQPLELHSRFSSEISVVEDDGALPSVTVALTSLSALREGVEADVVARVADVQPLKEFKRADKTGHLSKIRLSDGPSSIWAACWDENARTAQGFSVGDAVKVEGAVLKGGELSVSWSGRLLKNPPGHSLAELDAAPVKSLAALDGSESRVQARIDKVLDAQRLYKCRSCGTKTVERKTACTCGSEDFSSLVYASAELSDASGAFRAVLFDSAAEAFLGANATTDLNLLASLKRDYLAGKEVTLLAYAKKSTVTGQKEIVGKAVVSIL